jgi:hypothetical protein
MKKTDDWIGVKEITPLNFVRMGLARAKSTTLIERASWKSNWEMYSDAEMKPLYDRVMDHLLKRHPHGEYLAVEEIFGAEVAKILAETGQVIMPPHRNETRKRKATDEVGEKRRKAREVESDDDIEMVYDE